MSDYAYEDRRSGWLEFAAILMFAVGFFRIISAIDYFADKHRLNDLAGGLFSDNLWAWGLWDLCIAALAILAGLSLLANGGFGRVVGYMFSVLIIVQGFSVVGVAPWYGAISITLGALVAYAIASNRREAT